MYAFHKHCSEDSLADRHPCPSRCPARGAACSAVASRLDLTTDPRSFPMPNERPTLTESQHQIKSLPRAGGHWGSTRSMLEISRPRRSPSRGVAVEEGTNTLSLLGLGRGEGLERALARVALRAGAWDRYISGGTIGDPKQMRRIPSSQAPSNPSHARPVARILNHQLPGCARTWRPCCRGEEGSGGRRWSPTVLSKKNPQPTDSRHTPRCNRRTLGESCAIQIYFKSLMQARFHQTARRTHPFMEE